MAPSGDPSSPARSLAGFAIGWVIASLVALYQATIDFEFANMRHWAFQRRAAGTLMDANPFGLVAALAGPAVVVALWPLATARRAALALGLSWFGLWASGSRSALLAGSIALVGVARYAGRWRPAGIPRRQVAALLGVGLIVIAMLAVTAVRVDNPVSRLARLAPDDAGAVGSWLAHVWERESYGTAANRMLRDSPVVGVGVGSYHALVPDYAQALVGRRLPPDNAQNWFRHQLVELGLLGSLGWIVWVAGLVYLIAAGQYEPDREVQAGVLRWLLLALGAASFVGVPTLNATAAFGFWVLAVWFVLQLDPRALRPVWVPRATSWVLALVLAVVYTAGLARGTSGGAPRAAPRPVGRVGPAVRLPRPRAVGGARRAPMEPAERRDGHACGHAPPPGDALGASSRCGGASGAREGLA